jgi:hypothetical protein
VSNAEWIDRYGSIQTLHTGPNGENPAPADEEAVEPAAAPAKAPRAKSPAAQTKATAAIADAMGVKPDNEVLAELDVTGTPDNGDEDAEAEAALEDAKAKRAAALAKGRATAAANRAAAKAAKEPK